MKLFNLLVLAALTFSYVIAGNYQTTFYGCPDECDAQEGPSCGLPTYPLVKGGTKYFVALSTDLKNYKSYCGHRVAVMLTNGSKKMLNVEVVDSCGTCDRYHIDLSSYAFKEILNHKDGRADVVWAIYDKKGNRKVGPYTSDIDKVAKKFSLSKSSFTSAFDESAKKLITSNKNVGEFKSSSKSESKSSSSSSSSSSKGTTTDGKCAQKNGLNCHTGECCSQYGYCGKTKDYCDKGCQKKYGTCW